MSWENHQMFQKNPVFIFKMTSMWTTINKGYKYQQWARCRFISWLCLLQRWNWSCTQVYGDVWMYECLSVCVTHPLATLHCQSNLTFYFLVQHMKSALGFFRLHVFSLHIYQCGCWSWCVCISFTTHESNVYTSWFSFFAIFQVYCWLQYTWIG